MAGRLIALVLFLVHVVQCEAYEINGKECQEIGAVLHCSWRGRGNYIVSGVLKQETIEFNQLMSGSNLFVPRIYVGNLRKVEILQGDVSCEDIKIPIEVIVYIEKQKCVSVLNNNLFIVDFDPYT